MGENRRLIKPEKFQLHLHTASHYLKGPPRRMEGEFLQKNVVIGQGAAVLKYKRVSLVRFAIRKKLFTMRVERQGSRLPREDVDAQSLAEFNTRLEPDLVEGVTAHSSERQNKLMNLLNNKGGVGI